MRLRTLLITAAALIAIPTSAMAQTYTPVQSATISVSATSVNRGGTLTAQVNPGSTAGQQFTGTVTWFTNSVRTQVGQSTASNGGASLTFIVPAALENGTHTVEATGTSVAGTSLTVTRSFSVVGGTTLARTGSSNAGDLTRIGGALLVVGAALAYGVRRRIAHNA